jgi:hypothetical protein
MEKKILLCVVTAFLFVSAVNAQSKKSEIDLGIGVWSTNQMVGTMSDMIISGLTNVKMEDGSYIGVLHLGYKYSLSDRFALGPVFAYDRGTSDAMVNNAKAGKFTSNYYTLALEADYKYINRDKFKFYSLLGFGGSMLDQKYKEDGTNKEEGQNQTFFNFQVTPVGLKFGGSFGIFTELGFGYKGIVNVGLFCRF